MDRKKALKEKGYFTVNDLLQKLQELKEKGFGDELVGSDLEHYQYCEFDPAMGYVIVE